MGIQQLSQNKNIPVIKELSIQPYELLNHPKILSIAKHTNRLYGSRMVEWWLGRASVGNAGPYRKKIDLPSLTLQFPDEGSEKLIRTATFDRNYHPH